MTIWSLTLAIVWKPTLFTTTLILIGYTGIVKGNTSNGSSRQKSTVTYEFVISRQQ